MATTTTVTVQGMTCDHCVAAVRDEVGRLPGVLSVDVDLATGSVSVASVDPMDAALLAAAVDEAGYEVVS